MNDLWFISVLVSTVLCTVINEVASRLRIGRGILQINRSRFYPWTRNDFLDEMVLGWRLGMDKVSLLWCSGGINKLGCNAPLGEGWEWACYFPFRPGSVLLPPRQLLYKRSSPLHFAGIVSGPRHVPRNSHLLSLCGISLCEPSSPPIYIRHPRPLPALYGKTWMKVIYFSISIHDSRVLTEYFVSYLSQITFYFYEICFRIWLCEFLKHTYLLREKL